MLVVLSRIGIQRIMIVDVGCVTGRQFWRFVAHVNCVIVNASS